MQPHSSTFFSLWWAIVRTKTMLQRVDISASTPDAEKYSRNDGSLLWPAWTEKKKSISTLFCEREKKNHLVSFIMMGGKIREIKDIYLKEPALLLLLKKRKKKNLNCSTMQRYAKRQNVYSVMLTSLNYRWYSSLGGWLQFMTSTVD